MQSRILTILLASSALAVSALPAQALEPSAAAQALGDALVKGTGGKSSFAGAAQEGANIVVQGLAITSHDSSDTVTFARTVIESPTEGGDGVFSAPRVEMSEGVLSGESAGTVAGASLTNVTVLKPPAAGQEASVLEPGLLFDTAEAVNLTVGPSDKPYKVTVARVSMEMSDVVNNVPQASKGAVETITIPPEVFADADFKPEMLGYSNIVLNLNWDGTRTQADKALDLRQVTLAMVDGGSLTLSGRLGNLPEPTAVQSAKRSSAASEIIVHNARIRYEDQSLTGRILEMQAKKQGVTREQYAQQISGALPFLLAALNNPQFQNQVSTALSAFLQDPRSLTIDIAPETPITGAEIRQIVGSAPQTLPDRLKAAVTANTP